MDGAKTLEKMIDILNDADEYASSFCVFHDSCEDCIARKHGANCMSYLKAKFIINGNVVKMAFSAHDKGRSQNV